MFASKKRSLMLIAVLCGFTGPQAYADNCAGRWNSVIQSSETIEVAKGHSITYWVDRTTATSENTAYNGVGACTGFSVTTPDGKTKAYYTCIRKNKDGDSWSDSGGMEPGSDKGSWTQVGGTGVFAAKNGSGGWWQVLASDGKVTTGTWGGNCK